MKFSWKAIALSPLVIPFVYSAAIAVLLPSKDPILGFLALFYLGSVFSLAVSILILLPVLFLISRFTPLTACITALVGTVLGGIVYLPVIWQSYLESGDNSGPPQASFVSYLQQHFWGIELWAFLIGGFVTAMLYWLLTKDSRKTW